MAFEIKVKLWTKVLQRETRFETGSQTRKVLSQDSSPVHLQIDVFRVAMGNPLNLLASRDPSPLKSEDAAVCPKRDCCCLVAKLCPTLCDPMDCSPPGSSVHGISQATILEWVAISFSRGFSKPRDQTHISCLTGGFLSLGHLGSQKKDCYQPTSCSDF